VLKGVDLKGCEDDSLCAFIVLCYTPERNTYVRQWDASDTRQD
jgi:hypothetical protein